MGHNERRQLTDPGATSPKDSAILPTTTQPTEALTGPGGFLLRPKLPSLLVHRHHGPLNPKSSNEYYFWFLRTMVTDKVMAQTTQVPLWELK